MNYTKLGNSDLNVSRICMGCMGFGDPQKGMHSWTLDEASSKEIVKRGLRLPLRDYYAIQHRNLYQRGGIQLLGQLSLSD